jgi:hypothetical protein
MLSTSYQVYIVENAIPGKTLSGIHAEIADVYKDHLDIPGIVWDKKQPYYFYVNNTPYRIAVRSVRLNFS